MNKNFASATVRRGFEWLARIGACVAFLWMTVPSASAFTAGCAPPSVPNFPTGNQYAQNFGIPSHGFGFSTRAPSCPDYTAIRFQPSQTIPPGVSVQLAGSSGNQSVRFTGTPTTVGDFGSLVIEVTENGSTWAAAASVGFVVASCLDWNGSSNRRFQLAYPTSNEYFAIPRPTAGVAYPFFEGSFQSSSYPITAYCTVANWTLDNLGGGTMNAVSDPGPTLRKFALSGTPATTPQGQEEGCLTPDSGPDATMSGFSASGREIVSVDFCFQASQPPGVTLASALPVGTVGTPYTGSLSSNGIPPLAFSLISGNLPPGLALASDGAITGTPTQAGSFTFEGAVTAQNGTASGTFSIAVNAAPTASPTSQAVPALPAGALLLLGMSLAGIAARRARRP